ncbi:SAM-dependent methyltransferase [Paenibacillus daejeonensis]|uniref:SAM-dependent methyltransferase n=1 Tax=Paenibacillus daejeonensis TaxID=135193 RepID=UPI0003823C2F|nr:SAM-dependent methyltransferase [Paenibacillus daejeonensis]
MSRWIGTANRGFASYAMEELRRLLPGVRFTQLAAGEVFLMEVPGYQETVQETLLASEPIFLRHVQPVVRELPLSGNADDLQELSHVVRLAESQFEGKRTAVHVRRAVGTAFPYSAADTKALIDAVLLELDSEPSLQAPEMILSLYAAADSLLVGWGTPRELLSDWPGGAVRFQKEEGQVSRAKFKLLEAERAFGLTYANYRNAVDIGAAPGGWTSLLLERGLAVTAIDPAELHPSLHGYPRLTYLKKNASEAKLIPGSYDLLVCDMSWSPMQMCRLVLDLQAALAPGATAIITVKLMHRKPLQTIREVKERLQTAFHIRKAKQLFHNRDEITLYLEYKS